MVLFYEWYGWTSGPDRHLWRLARDRNASSTNRFHSLVRSWQLEPQQIFNTSSRSNKRQALLHNTQTAHQLALDHQHNCILQ